MRERPAASNLKTGCTAVLPLALEAETAPLEQGAPVEVEQEGFERTVDGWTLVPAHGHVRSLDEESAVVLRSPRLFPSWFDLCNEPDQLGPIPDEWSSSLVKIPTLPRLEQSTTSGNKSIALTTTSSSQPLTPEAMAVIVEIPPDEKPTGLDGRFSSTQKAKDVPRTSEQREFLGDKGQAGWHVSIPK
ncbi:hypothetical protein C8Q80DRAFT_1271321 [Daedaleopsis nitida]|nr:hypothetical protein C8Q80DRAFT_1271321 [Daedaleopsis nitida]